ncbi:MAG: alpha/beta hydrolase fold domain-containing protein [Planctomycetaceae bacterium]
MTHQRQTRATIVGCAILLSLSCDAPAQRIVIAPKGKAGRPSAKVPGNVAAKLDVVYARYGKRAMRLDLFTPRGKTGPLPAIAVVHGGGWLKGNKQKFRALAIALAKRGYVTAAVGYRLGGEAKFPAGIQDCNAAVRYLRANAKRLGIDPERIGAVGGSAGGHLVGLMATAPHVKAFQGDGGNAGASSQLQAAIVMAGPLELATGPVAEKSRKQPDKSNANKWFGKTVDQAPELYKQASPITHVSRHTPPMLFMAGEFDKPARNAATRKKLAALKIATGIVVVKRGRHGCWNREPFFTPMVVQMDRWFAKHLK